MRKKRGKKGERERERERVVISYITNNYYLFFRITEGAESILFREKFSDWPEPGRIIKMKGHVSSGEVLVS